MSPEALLLPATGASLSLTGPSQGAHQETCKRATAVRHGGQAESLVPSLALLLPGCVNLAAPELPQASVSLSNGMQPL